MALNSERRGIVFLKVGLTAARSTPPWPSLSTSALRPTPPTQARDPPHGHWCKGPSSRNQMSWKDIKQPGCPNLSARQPGHRLGLAHPPPPPSSKLPQLYSVGPWRRGRREVNEAWGGNYTNANRQMSHIVPGYNKQYGCLCYICIRKGGALRKPCFWLLFAWADYFFFPPSLDLFFFSFFFFSGSDLLLFFVWFIYLFLFLFIYFLLAKLFVELFSLKRCQLKTVVWATFISLQLESALREVDRFVPQVAFIFLRSYKRYFCMHKLNVCLLSVVILTM